MTTSTKYMLRKSRGVIFQEKCACGKDIDHGVVVGRIDIAIYSNI